MLSPPSSFASINPPILYAAVFVQLSLPLWFTNTPTPKLKALSPPPKIETISHYSAQSPAFHGYSPFRTHRGYLLCPIYSPTASAHATDWIPTRVWSTTWRWGGANPGWASAWQLGAGRRCVMCSIGASARRARAPVWYTSNRPTPTCTPFLHLETSFTLSNVINLRKLGVFFPSISGAERKARCWSTRVPPCPPPPPAPGGGKSLRRAPTLPNPSPVPGPRARRRRDVTAALRLAPPAPAHLPAAAAAAVTKDPADGAPPRDKGAAAPAPGPEEAGPGLAAPLRSAPKSPFLILHRLKKKKKIKK